MQLAHRLGNLGSESAFEVLARANALAARGVDVVHLEIGEPDFATPQFIKDAAVRALADGYTHYGPSAGLPVARAAFADYIARTRGQPCTPEEIVITPGAKPILFFGLMATVNPGDEVIIPNPGFPIYESLIRFLQAIPVCVPLREQNGFRLDAHDLERAITSKTKVVILNSPQNPTGGVLEKADVVAIAALAHRHDLWIISDEVYSRLLYDGTEHHSIWSEPGMRERTILIEGHSKTYAMTGWRLGYGVMPPPLAQQVARLQTNATSCTSALTQMAGVAAYAGPQDEIDAMVAEFKRRRDFVVAQLQAIPGVTCRKPAGAFYVFPGFHEFELTAKELEAMFLQAGVATLAGTGFGSMGEGHLRLSFANSMENLGKAIDRMREILRPLPRGVSRAVHA